MIPSYKRTIGYVNICSSVQDDRIKFKLLNQVLVMRKQDPGHIQEHLNQVRS